MTSRDDAPNAPPSDVHPRGGRRVEASIRVAAPRERVWAAWTDPAEISRWFTDRARGEVVEGGTFTWIFDEMEMEIPYPVAMADPPRRLVLAGEAPGRGPFALEVALEADGGETVVRLVNSGFLDGAEWDDEYRGVESGWQLALALLKHYLERYPGRTRRATLKVRPGEFGWDELPYRTAHELAGWLTRSGSIGDAGDEVSLVLHDGTPLTGTVLARTGTEAAVSWSEEDAVLELKAFAAGPARMRGVRLTAWDMPDARAARLAHTLEEAVERLGG